MILKSFIQRERPITLVHFLTNRCNARCAHCFIDFDDKSAFKAELSLEEIKRVVAHLGGALKNVNLTGGEPFLRRDLPEILDEYFLTGRVASVHITTNGFFGDAAIACARRFNDTPALADRKLIFSISLDDFPEEHDRNRKIPGLFERAVSTYHRLRELRSTRVLTNINLCVTLENSDRIPAIFRHLTEERGVRSISSIVLRGKPLTAEQRIKVHAGYVELNRLIRGGLQSSLLEGYGKSFLGRALNAKNLILHREVADTFQHDQFITPCYAGGLFGVIGANGDVFPCEMLSMKMGNLREADYDLARIFSSSKAKDTRHFIKKTNCHCTYECAWGVNILMNPRYSVELLRRMM